MNFIKDYAISHLQPADYNPRHITEEAFASLKKSISYFGMVKPVILNGTGVLTAGHQRIKAAKSLGLTVVPAIMLKDISLYDEIRFNLFHNSIETGRSKALIKDADKLPFGYSFIGPESYSFEENLNPTVVKAISDLYLKYGNWGSVVCDPEGKVLLNSDYAVTMRMYNEKLLVYKIEAGKVEEFLDLINRDYGEYNFEALKIKPYVQFHCQMNRSRDDDGGSLKSSLYEKFVLPNLKKQQRALDFGAGRFAYVNYLQSKGYRILGYEPFFRENKREIMISKVLKDLDNIKWDVILEKQFDVVILDSVINSITSLDYEKYVLTSCNGFMNQNGILYLATRSLESADERTRFKKTVNKRRMIEFLDKDNFAATFRDGNWTMQRFHTKDSLKVMLLKYFDDVRVERGSSQNYAICRKPKALPINQYEEALNAELNIEYPNNYRHNGHLKLVEYLLKLIEERNAAINQQS